AVIDKLKSMWNWLMDAIPGARKEEARLKLEAAAKKEGLGVTPAGSIVTLDSRGNPTTSAPITIPDHLIDLQAKYQALPGFAEGIADAVKAGLSTLGDTIADRIAEKMPDFSPLTNAIESLVSIFGKGASEEFAKSRHETLKDAGYKMEVIDGEPVFTDLNGRILTGDELKKAEEIWAGSGHASGVTFTSTGIYTGKFHGPEETLSQATTIKGPGIISRAIEALDISSRSTLANRGIIGNPEVHIHNENRFDFAGAKIDSSFDIHGFMREVDKRIEAGSKKAVERAIGQGRT
ncbi:MAG TPA: hypothetical protein PK712_08230, partial [Rectinema sp.]|nr:hypothetical protein [Rectinema sp.]